MKGEDVIKLFQLPEIRKELKSLKNCINKTTYSNLKAITGTSAFRIEQNKSWKIKI